MREIFRFHEVLITMKARTKNQIPRCLPVTKGEGDDFLEILPDGYDVAAIIPVQLPTAWRSSGIRSTSSCMVPLALTEPSCTHTSCLQ
jgi:hypothetical protein